MNSEYTDEEKSVIHNAEKKAMLLLKFSDRTNQELREKLKEGGFPPFAVEEAVEYVKKYHYLDDERYAEIYIRSYALKKSTFEIRETLKRKGISEETIDQCMASSMMDDRNTVKILFKKKYSSKNLTDTASFEKAIRYFTGRGFSYSDTKAGIKDAVEEEA